MWRRRFEPKWSSRSSAGSCANSRVQRQLLDNQLDHGCWATRQFLEFFKAPDGSPSKVHQFFIHLFPLYPYLSLSVLPVDPKLQSLWLFILRFIFLLHTVVIVKGVYALYLHSFTSTSEPTLSSTTNPPLSLPSHPAGRPHGQPWASLGNLQPADLHWPSF